MEQIRIRGGIPLRGEVRVQGSKNAALPMMAAALLHDGVCVLHRCPQIADVFCMERILRSVGAVTVWEGSTLRLDCRGVKAAEVDEEQTRAMRSSVILLGVLLGRFGCGKIGYPGGCVIGRRPIDLHLAALEALGAEICEEDGRLSASCRTLRGTTIVFAKRSVGATEQGILASVLCEGTTYLKNCAKEPEIVWLQRFLNRMGASVKGAGTEEIRIRGTASLHDAEFEVPPDRIAAGTYLCAAAATRGKIRLHGCPSGELSSFLEVYERIGGLWTPEADGISADASGVSHPAGTVKTAVYPGFPTDLQSPLLAALATIPGESHIIETIFEDRYRVVRELNRLGARICVRGRDAWVQGGGALCGCPVTAGELRGGAALAVLALAAEGETVIGGGRYIARGYQDLCGDLAGLGGRIAAG